MIITREEIIKKFEVKKKRNQELVGKYQNIAISQISTSVYESFFFYIFKIYLFPTIIKEFIKRLQ